MSQLKLGVNPDSYLLPRKKNTFRNARSPLNAHARVRIEFLRSKRDSSTYTRSWGWYRAIRLRYSAR